MRKAVLISLDAFFEPDIETLPADGAVRRVLEEGVFCRRVKTIYPALTYPIHVTIVTGCEPEKTGVGHNMPFQPDTPPERRVWHWERKYVQVPTLFEAVHDAGGECCSVLWPVNCRNRAVRRLLPESHPLPGENAVVKALLFGTPAFILHAKRAFGHLYRGAEEPYLSDFAAALTADTIRRKQPDFTALHLIDLDDMRHHHGTFSREANDAVSRLDRRVGEIRKAMEETPGMEDALLILVSDHGQADVRTAVDPDAMLTALGLAGDFRAWSNGMGSYFYALTDSADASAAAEKVREHMDEWGVSRVYTREDMDRMHAVKGPAFAVEAAEGVIFTGEKNPDRAYRATHGFGPGHPAENCLFAVCGKGIRKGAELADFRMRDVGPTVAGLMGLSLPEAQGKDRSAEFLEQA